MSKIDLDMNVDSRICRYRTRSLHRQQYHIAGAKRSRAGELPKNPAWGKGVDSDWRGRVGRDRRGVGEGLEDRSLEHRLQR